MNKKNIAGGLGGTAGAQVGCMLLVLAFNLGIGGWSVAYLLDLIGRQIPFWGAMLIGVTVAEISVPVALVIVILQWCGVF